MASTHEISAPGRLARGLLVGTLASLLLLTTTGCGGGQLGGGGLLASIFGGSGGGFTGGGGGPRSPGSSTLPNLGGPGSTGPSPTSMLPPPGGTSADLNKVLQTYGLQLYGSGATPEIQAKIASSLRHYSVENTRGLTHFNVVTGQGGSLAGLWQMRGGRAWINLYVKSYGVSEKTIVHELAHHWSLAADTQGGQALDAALPGQGGYVTNYSTKSRAEKLAEGTAWYLLAGEGKFPNTLSSWRPTQQGQQVIQQRIVANRPRI